MQKKKLYQDLYRTSHPQLVYLRNKGVIESILEMSGETQSICVRFLVNMISSQDNLSD